MGVIKETPAWLTPVYKIEDTDPLMGGEFGINNVQAMQLASRTLYLKSLFLVEHLPNGQHALTERNLARKADIAESKLNLPYSTAYLADQIAQQKAILDLLNQGLDGLTGASNTLLKSIYDALMLAWTYGHPRFAFDIFNPDMTFRDLIVDLPLRETVAGDDSIDVYDASTIRPGETYILKDNSLGQNKIVYIKTVLTNERVLLWDDEDVTRTVNGSLSKTDWDVSHIGTAYTHKNSNYITGYLTTLQEFGWGWLIISHKQDCDFSISYNRYNAISRPVWNKLELVNKSYASGYWQSMYKMPNGIFALKIEALGATEINHLALFSDRLGALTTTVRTPVIIDPAFQLCRFGAIYGAANTKTEMQFSINGEFHQPYGGLILNSRNDPNPVWDFKDEVLDKMSFSSQDIYWRARYYASDGNVSAWSKTALYTKD